LLANLRSLTSTFLHYLVTCDRLLLLLLGCAASAVLSKWLPAPCLASTAAAPGGAHATYPTHHLRRSITTHHNDQLLLPLLLDHLAVHGRSLLLGRLAAWAHAALLLYQCGIPLVTYWRRTGAIHCPTSRRRRHCGTRWCCLSLPPARHRCCCWVACLLDPVPVWLYLSVVAGAATQHQ